MSPKPKAMVERRVREALELLGKVGIPLETMTPHRRRRVALALLALANMKPDTLWSEASVSRDPSRGS